MELEGDVTFGDSSGGSYEALRRGSGGGRVGGALRATCASASARTRRAATVEGDERESCGGGGKGGGAERRDESAVVISGVWLVMGGVKTGVAECADVTGLRGRLKAGGEALGLAGFDGGGVVSLVVDGGEPSVMSTCNASAVTKAPQIGQILRVMRWVMMHS